MCSYEKIKIITISSTTQLTSLTPHFVKQGFKVHWLKTKQLKQNYMIRLLIKILNQRHALKKLVDKP
jgi:hypothetical protein